MSPRENPYSQFRFLREWQYVWLEYTAYMQAALCGNASISIQKAGLWEWIKRLPQKFLGKLGERPAAPDVTIKVGSNGPDFSEADKVTHEWLQKDWNDVYRKENYKGTVLGMIAKEMQSKGVDLNDLKEMSLSDLNLRMQEEGYKGLDDLEEYLDKSGWTKDQYYAHIWAQNHGGEWLAVYNDQGERAGRPYDIITKMYRDILAQAIEENVPPDKIRQRLVFANDSSVKAEFTKADGTLDDDAYQQFVDRHLNRDFIRFAVTETAMNYGNGKLLQTLREGGDYVRYMH